MRSVLRGSLSNLLLWIPVTGLSATVLLGMTAARTTFSVGSMLVVLWLPLALYLVFGKHRTRCGHLDMALPVAGPSLWLRHAVTVLSSAGLVLAATLLLVALLQRGLSALYTQQVGPDLLHPALLAGAGLLLTAALLDLPDPELRRIRFGGGNLVWTALVVTGVLAALLALAPLAPIWSLAPAFAAAAVARWGYLRAPRAYALVPTAPEELPKAAARHPRESTPGTSGGTLRLLFRIVDNIPKLGRMTPFLTYPLILLMGMVLGNIVSLGAQSNELRYLYIPLIPYMLLALLGPRTSRLHHLDPLPISRRRIFRVLMVPGILTLCLGYGIGHALVSRSAGDRELVRYHFEGDHAWASVPIRYLGVSRDGRVPTLEAPWGESHPAWSTRPWTPSEVRVYSPYASSEEASPEFEAWLVSRAAAEVYGIEISHSEVLESYFEVEEGRLVGTVEGGLTLAADHPGHPPAPEGPYFPILMTVVLVPWLLVTALFFRSFRTLVPEWVRQTIFWAFLVSSLGLMTAQIILALNDVLQPRYLTALWEVPLRAVAQSPLEVAAVWIGGLLLIAGSYRLAATQFEGLELPTKPSKFTLVEWTCEPE